MEEPGRRVVEGGLAGRILLVILKGLGTFEAVAPFRIRLAAHRALGIVLRVAGIRRKVVRENLEVAYPGSEQAGVRLGLEKQAYDHLGSLVFEVPLVFAGMERFVRQKVIFKGADVWRQAASEGRGVLFLSSHVGNWEVMAAAGAAQGMPLMIVTKRLKPSWFHEAMERGRRRVGVEGAYEPRTLQDVLRWLKAGKTVGFVLDQHAGPPVGVRVPVFGVPAGTHTAPALIARRTGARVLPVVNYRTPEGGWVVEVEPPLELLPDGPEFLGQQTAIFSAHLEKHIRRHPEQWLWIHKRFKGDRSPIQPGEWIARSR